MKTTKSKKALALTALFLTTQMLPAPKAQAGIIFGVAPFAIADSQNSGWAGLAAAVFFWPLGAASLVVSIYSFATSHPVAGGILLGLNESADLNELSSFLAQTYPEISDPSTQRSLSRELRAQLVSTETMEVRGQAVRYVTIPKDKVTAILEPTGLLDVPNPRVQEIVAELTE